MYILSASKTPIELDFVAEVPPPEIFASGGAASLGVMAESSPITRAARAFFDLGRREADGGAAALEPAPPPPAVFRERASGLVRTVHREVVLRFQPGLSERERDSLLAKYNLEVRKTNPFVPDQVIVADRARRRYGADLLAVANDAAEQDEVIFATPNFVSEYRRVAVPVVPEAQWHLLNRGKLPGQLAGEDVDATDAWKKTHGRRAIVVAVLDDGVDVDHPNLKSRIWRNRDKTAKDQVGRDFFLPDDHPDHYNPRPKKFRFPFDQMAGNDIHGTPCAGVVAAAGKGAFGLAYGSRILAVKVFHADDLAEDERVADAIRYAATRADILSCSWSGPRSPDIELAIQDAGRIGRNGRGALIFCAAGNEARPHVSFPASDPNTAGVGASTDAGTVAFYSNTGQEIDFVAPSSGGKQAIFTTDVSIAGRGFNVGIADRGGADGLHTNVFGGTSSATPLAAGAGALVLSINPKLGAQEVRHILQATADKIGGPYDAAGHSNIFGYGRINAAKAVAAARKP